MKKSEIITNLASITYLYLILLQYNLYLIELRHIFIITSVLLLLGLSNRLNSQISIQYHLMQGKKELNEGNYQQSISLANKVLYYQKAHTDAFLLRGVAKYFLSDYYGAKSDFTQIILHDPHHYEAYYFRGVINAIQGRTVDALSDLNLAIEYFEYNPDYYSYRGGLLLANGDTLQAQRDYEQAIELDKEHFQSHLNLSQLKLYKKELKTAIGLSSHAIGLKPNNESGYITRGKCYYLMDSVFNAEADLKYALRLDSTNIEAYFILGLVFQKDNRYSQALKCYENALKFNPYNSIVYYNRAILYSEIEQYTEAIQDYTKVIELNQNNVYAYLYRGKSRYLVQDLKGAHADLSVSINLFPKFVDAYRTRALVNLQLGDTIGYYKDRQMYTLLGSGDSSITAFDANSTYMEGITEFKSDFSPIFSGKNLKAQYVAHHIELLPLFKTHLVVKNAIPMFSDINFDYFDEITPPFGKGKIAILNEPTAHEVPTAGEWEECLDSMLKDKPGNINLNFLMGLTKGWNGVPFHSEKYLEQAMVNSNFKPLVFFVLANHYLQQAEEIKEIIEKNMVAGIQALNVKEEHDHKIVKSYYFRAIGLYKKVLLYDKDFVYAIYNMAHSEAYLKNYNLAIELFTQCIIANPDFKSAYFNRGLLRLVTGDIENACYDLSKAGELGIEQSYNIIYKYCD